MTRTSKRIKALILSLALAVTYSAAPVYASEAVAENTVMASEAADAQHPAGQEADEPAETAVQAENGAGEAPAEEIPAPAEETGASADEDLLPKEEAPAQDAAEPAEDKKSSETAGTEVPESGTVETHETEGIPAEGTEEPAPARGYVENSMQEQGADEPADETAGTDSAGEIDSGEDQNEKSREQELAGTEGQQPAVQEDGTVPEGQDAQESGDPVQAEDGTALQDAAITEEAEGSAQEGTQEVSAEQTDASETASDPVQAVASGIKQMTLEVIDFLGDGFGDGQMLSSRNKNLLIDTYSTGAWSVLRQWLVDNKYKDFDIYISHYHDDHIGNINHLLNDGSFNIGTLYLPDYSYMTGSSSYMKNYISMCDGIINNAKNKNKNIVYLKKGSSFTVGDVTAKVLWGTTYKSSSHDTHYINNNSLLTRFTCGDVRYLNGGDIESETEREILNAKIDISADIFKLSHHGGNTSNTDAFLKAVNAAYYYYDYCEDSPSKYSPSGSWSYTPTQNAKKYGNVASLRYNGNITYGVYDNVISQNLERNYSQKTVYLYDKTETKKLKGVVTLRTNSASTQRIDARSYGNYGYSTTKRTGTYADDGWIIGNGDAQYYYKNNAPVTGWLKTDGKWYYFLSGSGIKDTGWEDIGGETYFFDKYGVMQTGFVKIGWATHYFDENGHQAKTGWKQIGGKWYYFGANNKLMFGKQTIGGKTYILNKTTGAMHTGVVSYEGKLLFCDANGELKTSGWQTFQNKKYYIDPELGTVVTGWEDIGNYTYYFDTKGAMQTGFVKVGAATHYFDANGHQLKTGWHTINGKKYYFGEYNKLRFGLETIGGKTYTLDENTGELRTGVVTIGGAKYFSNTSGIVQIGWQTLGGKKYYADPSTKKLVTGTKTIDGGTYYFETSGAVKTGFYSLSGKTYYADPSTGKRQFGWKTVDGNDYYLDKSTGVMATAPAVIDGKAYCINTDGKLLKNGWKKVGAKWYLADKKGVCRTGWNTIGVKTFYFDSTGARKSGISTIDGKKYIFNTSGVLIKNGRTTIGGKIYRADADGVMQTGVVEENGNCYFYDASTGALRTMSFRAGGKAYCADSTGKLLEPGWQTVGGKTYYVNEDRTCKTAWQRINGKLYFFSNLGVMATGTQTINGKTFVFGQDGALKTGN